MFRCSKIYTHSTYLVDAMSEITKLMRFYFLILSIHVNDCLINNCFYITAEKNSREVCKMNFANSFVYTFYVFSINRKYYRRLYGKIELKQQGKTRLRTVRFRLIRGLREKKSNLPICSFSSS